ncbi:hypothetical protein A0O34_01785 [Chryseobacterium glaciei]|uniref:Uncharacterized protein n=1 Tax=Chryseobacterium glaciei TaxID=1685010 RepID=A0A172XQX7_9FLAO|nr:hypothetical protein [Chryseobacterium glaciei]ANF49361.1 hypothetical protein A0O34_01785 [Chryseobacterium glaciei]
MKKLIVFILLFVGNFIFSQKIPVLNLRSSVESDIRLPVALNNDELCIILQYNNGWSAYDTNRYYIFKNNRSVEIYNEEFPKSYLKNKELKTSIKRLELTAAVQDSLFKIINSKKIIEFQKYDQSDFKIKLNSSSNMPPPCRIYDSTGYSLKFIQNNKQNAYSYYAPEYYLEKCPDKSINKIVLKEYLQVLQEFWNVKL